MKLESKNLIRGGPDVGSRSIRRNEETQESDDEPMMAIKRCFLDPTFTIWELRAMGLL